MNSNDIEALSVSAVKDSLIRSGFLDPFIAEKDKQPSWDGYVIIYSDKNKTKDKIKGRIAVQVKGTETNNLSKSKITFTVEKVDLLNYLYDGGIILFVVYIDSNGDHKKIYYTELTPIKLREILRTIKKDKKNITLTEFPTSGKEKASIFLNFYEHSQMQTSFAKADLQTLEKLNTQGVLESISTSISGYGLDVTNPYDILLQNDENYFYANVKGSSIPQPLDFVATEINISQKNKVNVTVNGTLFYNEIIQIKSKDNFINKIGQSFFLKFNNDHTKLNIKYKGSNFLRVLVNDLGFLLAAIESGQIELNEHIIPLDFYNKETSHFDFEQMQNKLVYLRKVVKVFDLLGATTDIDISQLSKREIREIDHLVTAFIEEKPVSGLKSNLPPVLSIKIADFLFTLRFTRLPNKNNTYNIFDFFTTEGDIWSRDDDGNEWVTSPYSILTTNNFLTVTNINYDLLLPSFQNLEDDEHKYIQANNTLLHLLNAYDASNGKKPELLQSANGFSEWLLDAADNILSFNIRWLNRFQVIKRQRNFTSNEIIKLKNIIDSNSTSEDELVGAYLLLDNQNAAKIHFDNLDSDDKEVFKTFPIYHFWKSM